MSYMINGIVFFVLGAVIHWWGYRDGKKAAQEEQIETVNVIGFTMEREENTEEQI